MVDAVGTFGLWGCAVLAVVAAGWGVVVLATGKAPHRELRHFSSVSRYGWFSVGLGAAFGLLALGNGLGGWFRILTLAGIGMLAWLVLQHRRSTRINHD